MPSQTSSRRCLFAVLVIAGLGALAAHPASADDRDLLRTSASDPYVFILLDTSGSMHWSPKCPVTVIDPVTGLPHQEPANPADCAFQCPTGDCYTPLNGDDPASKLYEAKAALYQVLSQIDDVNFGFGTYNQDDLYLQSKHWLYHVANTQSVGQFTLASGARFPALGSEEVFGRTWACTSGSNIGCDSNNPADLNDAWELARIRRLPKLGDNGNTTVTVYFRDNADSRIYQLNFRGASGQTLGNATFQADVEVRRCTNGSCSSSTQIGRHAIDYSLVHDFNAWDLGANQTNPQLGYFNQGNVNDSPAQNTCSGWDPNTDTTADRHNGYSVRFPTDSSDPRGTFFTVGDVIPLDWNNKHRDDILNRLAPNRLLGETTPDFSTARYFNDHPTGSDTFLRLRTEAARPIAAWGSTPLGASMRSFRQWYAGCATGSCPSNQPGWSDLAGAQDPDFGCRRKFLLILTDGDETCGGDPCAAAQVLHDEDGVRTFVVAFGVDSTQGNTLNCIASNGGTGAPVYPANQQQLVDVLTQIFGEIRQEARSFASAAVPSVQAEVSDKIYLSSFTPLNARSIWDGHVDAFLKPLPLDPSTRRPDTSTQCSGTVQSACHLWDAGAVLLSQAPTASDVTSNNLKLGTTDDTRRVLYPKTSLTGQVPADLRLFQPSTDPIDRLDMLMGLGVVDTIPPTTANNTVRDIVNQTLVQKMANIGDSTAPQEITYVLGDIFHADPVIVDNPQDFRLYSADLFSEAPDSSGNVPSCASGNHGYRCFADKQKRRRKMLAVGSDDGQLHFFDAGIWNSTAQKFSDGTGKELFSFMPRGELPIVRDLAQRIKQIYGVDGTPRVDDVFIDPKHEGTFGAVAAADREWRTVLVGGLREGGKIDRGGTVTGFVSGYYALDVTQPDTLTGSNEPTNQNVVPTCLQVDTSSGNAQEVGACQLISGGRMPFPAELWEFTDTNPTTRLQRDEDLNGFPDLADTWSVPTIGRIRVTENGTLVDKFVAIVGGGMDATNKNDPKRGNYLYMIDIETGKAIYKQRLDTDTLRASVPADPAVVDFDLDGIVDTIYIGTTAGILYKVDLTSPVALEQRDVPVGRNGAGVVVNETVTRIFNSAWAPFPIFDTEGRPIYYSPTALFVSDLDTVALAFGTGDRENLWEFTSTSSFPGVEGRFYLIVDENFTASQVGSALPKVEADYEPIAPDGAAADTDADFVLSPDAGRNRGWFLQLEPDERVIAQAFGLSGIVIFSSYEPQVTVSGVDDQGQDVVCARTGTSRIFVVYANNANSVLTVDSSPQRYRTIPEFVTNPYVERGQTKNPSSGQGSGGNDELQTCNPDDPILQALKNFCPPNSKFGNYCWVISAVRSDTGLERYATAPICIVEKNWKEY